jgi:FtsP/CotA-like multicopper oxidase with cupredoxin domain
MKSYVKAFSATLAAFVILLSLTGSSFSPPPVPPGILDPTAIPKWVNQLVIPPVYVPTNITDGNGNVIRQDYHISMYYGRQGILPPGTPLVGSPDGKTLVWGYQGDAIARGLTLGVPDGTFLPNFFHSPSSTFEATRGVPIQVTWTNNIDMPQFLPVDPTLHWANPNNMPSHMDLMPPYPLYPPGFDGTVTDLNPEGYNAQAPVPLVTHLHEGEVQSYSDGGPEEWFTYNGIHGDDYSTVVPTANNSAVYDYPNLQQPSTLWYHDHALGMTRLNVMSGLAGYYMLREPPVGTNVTTPTVNTFDQYLTTHFPYGVSEIPIAIQDRSFYANGELWFPTAGQNPDIHPYWFPEFFGNTIMVNGRVWPNLDVTPGWYRLRLLEGSNARFYTLSFVDQTTKALIPFIQIASDGGYLMRPVPLTSLTFAPGERADVLIDFSGIPVGTKIILKNTAKAPFPNGAAPMGNTIGQIMQFTVKATSATPGAAAPVIPAMLNPTLTGATFPTLAAPSIQRILTLWEVEGPNGPIMAMLNGQPWAGDISELPHNGTTEDWIVIDLTGDAHPIHTHLATFQLVSRQKINAAKYSADWLTLQQVNGSLGAGVVPPWPLDYIPLELPIGPYLQGNPKPAPPNEQGWQDTVQMFPGEVTIIRIRWMQQDGTPYPFDASQGPGYVWHCHIVDHEDNEMMRPYEVLP